MEIDNAILLIVCNISNYNNSDLCQNIIYFGHIIFYSFGF